MPTSQLHPRPVETEVPPQRTAKPSLRLKTAATLLIAGFLAALILPLAGTDFKEREKTSQTENRKLNEFPAWSWDGKALDAFPAKFDAAFNDHFGFRSLLVRWHGLFNLHCLGISPTENVVLGKQGWLYLLESIKGYRGTKKLSKSEIDRWVLELKTKQAWCAARNIRYLVVVAPNKEDVYPEYLPSNVCRVRDYRYLDDILAALGKDSGVEVVDLQKTLLTGKAMGEGLVYDRTDTHWSQLGVFLATNEILTRLQPWFPELQPSPLSSRTLTRETKAGGDLAWMTGLQDQITEERVVISPSPTATFESAPMRFQLEWPVGALQDPPLAFEAKTGERKHTVLVTGDSFGRGLMTYLPEHFQRVVRLRPQLPYTAWFQSIIPTLVEAEKPDVFIDIYVSRSLKRAPKVPIGTR